MAHLVEAGSLRHAHGRGSVDADADRRILDAEVRADPPLQGAEMPRKGTKSIGNAAFRRVEQAIRSRYRKVLKSIGKTSILEQGAEGVPKKLKSIGKQVLSTRAQKLFQKY